MIKEQYIMYVLRIESFDGKVYYAHTDNGLGDVIDEIRLHLCEKRKQMAPQDESALEKPLGVMDLLEMDPKEYWSLPAEQIWHQFGDE